jgi:outer membrane murein-binding lipoprotein Lpp
MKKIINLPITAALASAMLLAGCHQTDSSDDWTAQRDTAVCVDRTGSRVSDDRCAPSSADAGNGFYWYYLGRSSAIPPYGERPAGGSFSRTAGATYFHAPVGTAMSRSAAISRGGFGSSAHSFGAFGE